jgi:hypothetical protein
MRDIELDLLPSASDWKPSLLIALKRTNRSLLPSTDDEARAHPVLTLEAADPQPDNCSTVGVCFTGESVRAHVDCADLRQDGVRELGRVAADFTASLWLWLERRSEAPEPRRAGKETQ